MFVFFKADKSFFYFLIRMNLLFYPNVLKDVILYVQFKIEKFDQIELFNFWCQVGVTIGGVEHQRLRIFYYIWY